MSINRSTSGGQASKQSIDLVHRIIFPRERVLGHDTRAFSHSFTVIIHVPTLVWVWVFGISTTTYLAAIVKL